MAAWRHNIVEHFTMCVTSKSLVLKMMYLFQVKYHSIMLYWFYIVAFLFLS